MNLSYLTFQIDRRFRDHRALHLCAGLRRQFHLLKFIDITPRLHAAVIGRKCQRLRRQIDDKLAAFRDQIVGITGFAHRNIGHRRRRVDDARPRDRDYIRFFDAAAADHDRRQRHQQGARFDGFFHRFILPFAVFAGSL